MTSIAQVLYTQGFGTRRECAALIARGDVAVGGAVVDDPHADLDTAGLVFSVQGREWRFHERAVVLLHKPAGYECSRSPRHHPGVLSLLPLPLRTRGVQPIGRLDEDTTGALLLSDDGALIHRLTSPRHHVPKVYEVTTKHAVDEALVARLLDGVELDDAPGVAVRAAACERSGPHALRLTLTEGRYHQVKRMLAAAGNRVVALHRSAFGPIALGDGLAPGEWRWLDDAELAALDARR